MHPGRKLRTLVAPRLLAGALAGALGLELLSSCVPVAFGARVRVAEPELVVIEPGLSVVADYPRAVYFVDDYYWWWDEGVWYRSRRHDAGWVRVGIDIVPGRVRGLDHKKYRYYVHRDGRGRIPPGHQDRDDDDGPPGHDHGRGHGRGHDHDHGPEDG